MYVYIYCQPKATWSNKLQPKQREFFYLFFIRFVKYWLITICDYFRAHEETKERGSENESRN